MTKRPMILHAAAAVALAILALVYIVGVDDTLKLIEGLLESYTKVVR